MSELAVVTKFAVTIGTDEKNWPAYCAEHDCEGNLWSGGSGSSDPPKHTAATGPQ